MGPTVRGSSPCPTAPHAQVPRPRRPVLAPPPLPPPRTDHRPPSSNLPWLPARRPSSLGFPFLRRPAPPALRLSVPDALHCRVSCTTAAAALHRHGLLHPALLTSSDSKVVLGTGKTASSLPFSPRK